MPQKFLKITGIALLSLSLIVSIGFPTLNSSRAEDLWRVIKKSELNLDTSMIQADTNFGPPKRIVLAPIFIRADVKMSSQDWYRGLFYYFSSNRFNYKDLPAHFVIDQEGNIFEGVTGGVEHKVSLNGSEDNTILVLYLADLSDSDFGANSMTNLESLLLSLANQNSIKPTNVSLSGLRLNIDKDKKLVQLATEDIFGSWKLTFGKIADYLNQNYHPVAKQYQLKILSMESLSNSVKMGSEVVLKLKLQNIGSNTVYSGTDGELLFTKSDGKDSKFFVNNLWVSRAQQPILPAGSSLRPDQIAEYDLKFKIPLYPGSLKEDFVLRTATGAEITNSNVTVAFNIDKGGANLLEIIKADANYVNIRRDPSSNSSSIGKGSAGERYIWTERNSSNWYKIIYEGNPGWVFGKYVKVV